MRVNFLSASVLSLELQFRTECQRFSQLRISDIPVMKFHFVYLTQTILVSTKTTLQNVMRNNSTGMVIILIWIGNDSIRMLLIPKLRDGINCVFLMDKRDKLAPMSPQNINKTTGFIGGLSAQCKVFKIFLHCNLIRVSHHKTEG